MYIRVKLLNGFRESFTYKVPEGWNTHGLVGSLIEVPLQKRHEIAFVEELFESVDTPTYKIREASSDTIVPSDPHYMSYLTKLSAYYGLTQLALLRRIKHFLQEKHHETSVIEQVLKSTTFEVNSLTIEQTGVLTPLIAALDSGTYYPALLQGVTGSGKTEIYKRLLMHAWQQGKSALFLLPEVSLAVQFTHLLKTQLPSEIALFSFHSATSQTEKKALWKHLLQNKKAVIIGVHLPILLAIPHLGLIILDEEHEVGYQAQKHPKINTKEAAFIRAQTANIPILAGSATPSISSLYNVKERGWHFYQLTKRYAGSFPTIEVVKLTENKQRKHFWISAALEQAIKDRLEKKEQTIIFLNRRGYSFFIQCTSCGFIPHCTNCSVSLTLHNNNRLMCHYCTYCTEIPLVCSCKGSSFLKKGIGTQQVVSILEKLFPTARIARADLDTTVNKKQWRETMQAFEEGTLDILVGTQTITKGYHFPGVTLVGILWADINLSLPVYNAAEVSLQQLIQVSGRAGRQSTESLVIVQTFIDHPIFHYLNEQQYSRFYDFEIQKRQLVSYPPIIRFAEIEFKHEDELVVTKESEIFAQSYKHLSEKNKKKVIILGPSIPPVQKIKQVFSRKIYIKAQTIHEIISLYTSIDKSFYKSGIFFTPNPLS